MNSGKMNLWVLYIFLESREKMRKRKRNLPSRIKTGEFDPGSEQTLAACLTHASRTRKSASVDK